MYPIVLLSVIPYQQCCIYHGTRLYFTVPYRNRTVNSTQYRMVPYWFFVLALCTLLDVFSVDTVKDCVAVEVPRTGTVRRLLALVVHMLG
jgi:hypothetical protein